MSPLTRTALPARVVLIGATATTALLGAACEAVEDGGTPGQETPSDGSEDGDGGGY